MTGSLQNSLFKPVAVALSYPQLYDMGDISSLTTRHQSSTHPDNGIRTPHSRESVHRGRRCVSLGHYDDWYESHVSVLEISSV